MSDVGFIGLGLMGSRMARNLLKSVPGLLVHNRTKDKATPLINDGAAWIDTPAELAGRSRVLFSMLANPDTVREVILGDSGLLHSLPNGALWIDCSTIDPQTARDSAARAAEHGVRYVEAPVAGSTAPAEAGALTFFVGGSAKDLDAVKPMLQTMGKKILHVGDVGKGSSMKLAVNLFLGGQMAVFCEVARLGRDLGVPEEMLLDTLLNERIAPGFLLAKRPKFDSRDYEVQFPLELMRKDIHLSQQTAYRSGSPVPIGSICGQVYGLAQNQGLGRKDFSALYSWFESV